MQRRTPLHRGSKIRVCAGVSTAVSILLVACSSDPTETPGPSGGAAGAQAGSPAAGAPGGAPSSTAGRTPGAGGAGAANAGSPTIGGATGGSLSAGSSSGGSSSGGPSGGAAAGMGTAGNGTVGGAGGATPGTGGSTPIGGGGGTGVAGSSAGRGGSTTGGAAVGGAGSGAGGAPAPDIDCPQGATFCSGFEGMALPDGTKFHAVGPTAMNAYVFDTTQFVAGRQSLSIPMHSGGFYYRALAVPVPGQNFWVRLHVRVSRAFGDDGHDSLFGASTGNLEADVNNEALVEFSEQFGEVLLNTDDQLFNPEGATTLAADRWHCLEAHYDGATGNVEVFANGMQIMNAPGYAKRSFQSFRIGYMQYHDTRAVWFDNVVVAPARVNCP